MNQRRLSKISFAVFAASAFLLFQNCGSFHSADLLSTAASNSSTGGDGTSALPGSSGVTPTPPQATPTPSPTPAQTVSKTFVFAGGTNFIQGYMINHANDQVTVLAKTALANNLVGWLAFDPTTSTLYAPSASNTTMARLALDQTTGALTVKQTDTNFFASSVHLSLSRVNGALALYAASYDNSGFASYDAGTPPVQKQAFAFNAGAHSHSSAIDEVRNLVFVANKDESRIVVYSRDAAGVLTQTGEIPTANPRMVTYDSTFDHLYSVSEADTGMSEVKIFNVVRNGNAVSYVELQKFQMGLRGADFAVDHRHGYIAASVREAGKEGVWALPVTAQGTFDTTRANKFIPVSGTEARSMKITADGQYYIVTCNSGANAADVFIYKMTYDATNAITDAKLIQALDAGAGSFFAHAVIDVK